MPKQTRKILIVDDESDIVEILSYNLAQEDFEIFKAYDGKQAVSSALLNHPDVIIMDVWMPEMSGLEACRMMRRSEGLKNTPVLILTADTDEYTGLEAAEAGCSQFVTKSVKPAFIVSMVKDLILPENEIPS
jgi:two-component system, OmpR family, alkaline phosphatase synthesis response regulator PhoP